MPSQTAAERGKAKLCILDFKTPWLVFQKSYQTTAMQGKAKLHIQLCQMNVIPLVERGKTFPLFQPSFQKISGTNDTSFKSPYIGRLESAKNWAWHHPEGDYNPLIEKVLLLLELICSLS